MNCLSYALQHRTHPFRRLCVRWMTSCSAFPLAGRLPSLSSARVLLKGVRRVPRYYTTVRLPGVVHQRLASLDFPLRPAMAPSATGDLRLSRFPRKVFPRMSGVSDRVEPVPHSRQASRPANVWDSVAFCAFDHMGAPELIRISRLHTRPAGSRINASPTELLLPVHDSGPIGFANP